MAENSKSRTALNERDSLQDMLCGESELAALGLRVVPGAANYLLFQSQRPLAEPLRQRGILLRGCGNYEGLDESWYRTAVRTHAENEVLVKALEEVLR